MPWSMTEPEITRFQNSHSNTPIAFASTCLFFYLFIHSFLSPVLHFSFLLLFHTTPPTLLVTIFLFSISFQSQHHHFVMFLLRLSPFNACNILGHHPSHVSITCVILSSLFLCYCTSYFKHCAPFFLDYYVFFICHYILFFDRQTKMYS